VSYQHWKLSDLLKDFMITFEKQVEP